MKRVISALLIFILFISCDRRTEYLELNKTFDLAYGKCIRDNSNTLSVCFDSIITDSRCPEDVVCCWAGEAIVRFKIQGGQIGVRSIDLKLSNDTLINGYKFSFVSLTPYPSMRNPIILKDYKARIIVNHD